MVSPSKSKRKTDVQRSTSPLEGQDRQLNVEMSEANPIFQRQSLGSTFNPFAAQAAQQQPQHKKLVSVDTLMRHTGSKEELHHLLTVQGKRFIWCNTSRPQARSSYPRSGTARSIS